MTLIERLKWLVAPKEMEELDRWRIQWHEHRRWFAEFPVAAVTLDHMKATVDGEPITGIHVVRDSCRRVVNGEPTYSDGPLPERGWDSGETAK